MYGINLQLRYILRKTCGFAQIAQKKLRKIKISFHAQHFAKNIIGFAQIAQILRKRFSHFVETLIFGY